MRLTLLLALALSACANPGPRPTSGDELGIPQPRDVEKVHTDIIRQMIAQEQYYAALAHIDEQVRRVGSRDALEILRADALARLERREEAETVYQGLLRSDFAARAHHGLGLLYVDLEPGAAIGHLRKAVQREPTDAQMRNDLGFALMSIGRLGEAQHQLSTAVELEPGNNRWRNNMVLLLLVQGQSEAAARLARQTELPSDAFERLRVSARQIRGEWQ